MEDGVKNLKGARLFPETFSNNGNVDAHYPEKYFDISFSFAISSKEEINGSYQRGREIGK
jgi:hypothetical protein